ncbi:hypothetical protein SAMN04487948_104146 [Halogranum amylolyticum]|uniref:Uncharacterized protein n=1 Tax=Halogranum amylolyticum TaxID=660520 RepID=A0A1H8RNY0_9EURY|nr:hypothetical protein [Halogranum amylolyticum]SEO68066.1 hypothetical protein SAMN04487948_104146 [Halogranum amylolyticum]
MGLKRVGMALFGVGVFIGTLALVAVEYLDPELSANVVLGAIGLVVLGVLVGGVGVVRTEAKWEP